MAKVTEDTEWRTSADVRRTFNTADFVQDLTVFDAGGNKYRVTVFVHYHRRGIHQRCADPGHEASRAIARRGASNREKTPSLGCYLTWCTISSGRSVLCLPFRHTKWSRFSFNNGGGV
ncbi:MAG: type II toxin-antitoxin system HigB family toxin [Bryobacterales bacterium]|nr:type II toxin-antitoxin system HigB family toxin [Bryobacterales bacterium]